MSALQCIPSGRACHSSAILPEGRPALPPSPTYRSPPVWSHHPHAEHSAGNYVFARAAFGIARRASKRVAKLRVTAGRSESGTQKVIAGRSSKFRVNSGVYCRSALLAFLGLQFLQKSNRKHSRAQGPSAPVAGLLNRIQQLTDCRWPPVLVFCLQLLPNKAVQLLALLAAFACSYLRQSFAAENFGAFS